MAENVFGEIETRRGIKAQVGKQILDVITAGMYSDPRMSLREYVQNSADSIDVGISSGLLNESEAHIDIILDGKARSIVIEDNGAGLDNHDAENRLGGIGCSSKVGLAHRGFRGIGRLGGLAYCDLLRFETRSSAREHVAVVEWSGNALREQVAEGFKPEHVETAIRRMATFHLRKVAKDQDPAHFFRVTMVNVHKFHSDLLMNIKGLREYLAQVLPVAFDRKQFSFAEQIESYLSAISGFRSYQIVLNGLPVNRPYRDLISLRENRHDRITGVELLELQTADGGPLCRGWYAKTSFLSAFPPHETMRGVRVRQGNIGVGNEDFLKDLFAENRFAIWHIGEMHIGNGLKLNARRDGFEESSEYERFLEWSTSICRELSYFCRKSSTERSSSLMQTRIGLEVDCFLNSAFFLDETHKNETLASIESQIQRLKKIKPTSEDTARFLAGFDSRIDVLRRKPAMLSECLDGRSIRRKDPEQILSEVCQKIRKVMPGITGTALMKEIVGPYMRDGV